METWQKRPPLALTAGMDAFETLFGARQPGAHPDIASFLAAYGDPRQHAGDYACEIFDRAMSALPPAVRKTVGVAVEATLECTDCGCAGPASDAPDRAGTLQFG